MVHLHLLLAVMLNIAVGIPPIVNISVLNALSNGSSLVKAVLLCMKRGQKISSGFVRYCTPDRRLMIVITILLLVYHQYSH